MDLIKMGKELRYMQKPKLIKLIIIAALIITIAISGTIFAVGKFSSGSDKKLTGYTVEKGDISVSISGSGTVEPVTQYDIVSIAQGEILADNVTVGQTVNAGDLLYQIDTTDAENNIKKSQIALEKQKLSYSENQESIANLTVKAPFSGVISELYVKEGDSVNSGTKIADITDSHTLTVTLPFNSIDASNISASENADITLETTGENLNGTVTNVSTGTYTTDAGAIVSDVTIEFKNPGALKSGDTATAVVGNYACNSSGTIEYSNEETILAQTSGKVESLNYSTGDKVSKDATILTLDNSSVYVSAQSASLAIEDAQLSLDDMTNALGDYNLTSPISGTIIAKDYKAGDTLDTNKTTLATVADMSKLKFTMNIDELDISSISVGQSVKITADALPDKTFSGSVSSIGIVGTSSSGVTTYPVEVIIDEYEGLLPGMNVTADIISQQVTDVLKIPVSAVSRGNLVLVTEEYAKSLEVNKSGTSGASQTSANTSASNTINAADNTQTSNNSGNSGSTATTGTTGSGTSTSSNTKNSSATSTSQRPTGNTVAAGTIVKKSNAPTGYVYIKVTVGITDDSYIEVTGGLTEGAEVYVEVSTAASTSTATTTTKTTTTNASAAGGMGMDMGGPPSGGGPMG